MASGKVLQNNKICLKQPSWEMQRGRRWVSVRLKLKIKLFGIGTNCSSFFLSFYLCCETTLSQHLITISVTICCIFSFFSVFYNLYFLHFASHYLVWAIHSPRCTNWFEQNCAVKLIWGKLRKKNLFSLDKRINIKVVNSCLIVVWKIVLCRFFLEKKLAASFHPREYCLWKRDTGRIDVKMKWKRPR